MKGIPVRNMDVSRAATPGDSFSIRELSGVTGGEEMTQEAHRHNFFYMLVVEKGRGEHIIDFTTYKISDHTLFFMRPAQVHRLRMEAGCTGYLIQFGKQFYFPQQKGFHHLLQKACSVNCYSLHADFFREIYALVIAIFSEATNRHEGYREIIPAHLSVLFARLIRESEMCYTGSGDLYIQQRMHEFQELLEKNAPFNKSVAEYAAMMHLSVYQLNAITRHMQGKTASESIAEYIVLEAKRRLLSTPETVGRIAAELGYEDGSYFIRFFKRHTGYSPDAFRKNFR